MDDRIVCDMVASKLPSLRSDVAALLGQEQLRSRTDKQVAQKPPGALKGYP